ncbi:hypothetical protein Acid345_0124 [Candidatus Koribacter versatilis Ellin345]|uniref:Uncharacterized protein n=1 Tax=Koribacter versatilis (strain Ellin345) TaxID=204669 RepID=Q1IVH1_KORVE|nr:hypothetical protein [Candidatus Koribacter versatilis]ABF39129.1 hypothetical protein Acid345_0124 [Candidatus Koribacter versatilis Ellin345]
MAINLCNHIKANGTGCESPALRDQDYCYFHTAHRQSQRRQRRAARLNLPFQLPLLEDAASIQLAINDTLNALLAGQIDHKTAGLLLYGLQTAAINVRHIDLDVSGFDRQAAEYDDDEADLLEEEIAADIAEEKKLEVVAAKKTERETAKTAANTATLPGKKPAARAETAAAESKRAVGANPTSPTAPKSQLRSDGMK